MPRLEGEQASSATYIVPIILAIVALAVVFEVLGVIDVIPGFGAPRHVTQITYPSTY